MAGGFATWGCNSSLTFGFYSYFRESLEEEVVVVRHGGVVEDVCLGGLAGGRFDDG